ncbi:MAG TPA: NAD-dependent epimerase/dehydratase family protein [Gemmatimonadales bacterium]|jgi:GDP-4-dehydro-6-deoxy-D-mannose reductase
MRVLVTGAEGFVGRRLVRHLVDERHEVIAAVRSGVPLDPSTGALVTGVVEFDLLQPASVTALERVECDAVVHLAAVASGTDARRDPAQAWQVNTVGTALVAETLAATLDQARDPVLLVVSTGEVYGNGPRAARREDELPQPCSPYAASKLGGEIAALEVHRRTGLRVIVARAFPHAGGGQDTRFAIPAFAERILAAKARGAPAVKVGNLAPVRDIMHVSDVVRAYGALLAAGLPGEVYNVATGTGRALGDVFRLMTELAGHATTPETDARLVRRADLNHLVGDPAKLRAATGWMPAWTLEDTLAEVLDAQTR